MNLESIWLNGARPYSWEKVDRLVEDIKINGLLKPIVVCKDPIPGFKKEMYLLLDGTHRYFAFKKLGYTDIPVKFKKRS